MQDTLHRYAIGRGWLTEGYVNTRHSPQVIYKYASTNILVGVDSQSV